MSPLFPHRAELAQKISTPLTGGRRFPAGSRVWAAGRGCEKWQEGSAGKDDRPFRQLPAAYLSQASCCLVRCFVFLPGCSTLMLLQDAAGPRLLLQHCWCFHSPSHSETAADCSRFPSFLPHRTWVPSLPPAFPRGPAAWRESGGSIPRRAGSGFPQKGWMAPGLVPEAGVLSTALLRAEWRRQEVLCVCAGCPVGCVRPGTIPSRCARGRAGSLLGHSRAPTSACSTARKSPALLYLPDF